MKMDLYFARRFLTMFALVFGAFMGILMLIDLIELLRRFSSISFGHAFYLALLGTPESLYQILPLIMILSSIALFLGLARSSELVVVRASGRSGLRFLWAPVGMALLIGALSVAVLNPLVAATTKEYDTLRAGLQRGGDGAIFSISAEGLWMRQGDENGQTVIRALKAAPDGTELADVTFFLFGPDGSAKGRIEAGKARLAPGQWVLEKAKQWDLGTPNPEAGASQMADGSTLPTDLTAARIQDSIGAPSAVAFWDIAEQVRNLERAGFSAQSYRVWFQMELALPLLLAAMVLIAAGFTMRHARFGKTGQMVLYALMGGFFIFFLRNFAQVLGENGQIPIMVAAWSPPVAASLLALSLLLHLEDG